MAEVEAEVAMLVPQILQLRLRARLDGPDDHRHALILVHRSPAAGDLAEDVLWRYRRWVHDHGGRPVVASARAPGSTVLTIPLPYAFGLLRGETGLHRDAESGDTALVEVIPAVTDSDGVLSEADLRIEQYRRTTSCGGPAPGFGLVLTHLPTGTGVNPDDSLPAGRQRQAALDILTALLRRRALPAKTQEARVYGQGTARDPRTGHESLSADVDGFIAAHVDGRRAGSGGSVPAVRPRPGEKA